MDPIRRYHSGPEWTWERWQWRGTPHFPNLQHHWNHSSRILALHHKMNIWWITGNNSHILVVGNLVHNELFLINKNANMSSFVLEMIEKLWVSFNPDSSWAGSEKVVASPNLRAHPKVFINCSADGSVANIVFFGQFWHWLSWVCLYQLFNPARKVLVCFQKLQGLWQLCWTLPSASNLARTR